jgi:hypothetical protein
MLLGGAKKAGRKVLSSVVYSLLSEGRGRARLMTFLSIKEGENEENHQGAGTNFMSGYDILRVRIGPKADCDREHLGYHRDVCTDGKTGDRFYPNGYR